MLVIAALARLRIATITNFARMIATSSSTSRRAQRLVAGQIIADERERQEEDADVDRRVADDHLEPEHERADREDDRAEEDAEQRDARALVERVLVGVADRLQEVARLPAAEAARRRRAEMVVRDRDEEPGRGDRDRRRG